jgi:hypothetical protein
VTRPASAANPIFIVVLVISLLTGTSCRSPTPPVDRRSLPEVPLPAGTPPALDPAVIAMRSSLRDSDGKVLRQTEDFCRAVHRRNLERRRAKLARYVDCVVVSRPLPNPAFPSSLSEARAFQGGLIRLVWLRPEEAYLDALDEHSRHDWLDSYPWIVGFWCAESDGSRFLVKTPDGRSEDQCQLVAHTTTHSDPRGPARP